MRIFIRGGLGAAPFAFLLLAGCASDPALAQTIHNQDEAMRVQREANEALRSSVEAAEKAAAAARAEIERLRGSDEACRRAQAALEARLQELEGAFQDPGGDVTVEKTEGGGYKFVVQGEVLFGTGADALTDEGRAALKKIADSLKGRREAICVEGHTANVPIVKAETKAKFPMGNLDLSLQRALRVADGLVHDGGLEAKRVSCAGYGEHRPRADNGTPDGRKKNRRVEILVEGP